MLDFKSSLHIEAHSPWAVVSSADIFSKSLASCLVPVTLSFPEQKILIVLESSFPTLSFMGHAFGVVSEKSSPHPRPPGFSLL